MPKASPIQTSFSAGEISPYVQGRVDVERYKQGLEVTLNYIPTLQGPLIRRPGTKYVANVKDPANPPTLIPFQHSVDQSYILEMGDFYVRFLTNDGQIISNTSVVRVVGNTGWSNSFGTALYTDLIFHGTRPNSNPRSAAEVIIGSTLISSGGILELSTLYTAEDTKNIKFAQDGDSLYLVHSSHPVYKLQRFSNLHWDIVPVLTQDGPYLPYNSYHTRSDSARVTLTPANALLGEITVGPNYKIFGAVAVSSSVVRVQTGTVHTFKDGDKVAVRLVTGTMAINNGTSSVEAAYWPIKVFDSTHIDLLGVSNTSGSITGSSANLSPALFEMVRANPVLWADASTNRFRSLAIIQAGVRYSGYITQVNNAASAQFIITNSSTMVGAETQIWQLGLWNNTHGFPSAVCFHQDRMCLSGAPYFPQQIAGSVVADHENFTPSVFTTLTVQDNSALQFNLLSSESNSVRWIKSSAQGLLAGSMSGEWQISPNNQAAALTPTNVNASPTSFFGAANIDAVQTGNATLYIQRAQRKLREMNFFFQVGTFRSTDLAELSEHITSPSIIKMAVQKEPLPIVWALRSDGVLCSMSYNRDEQTIKAGWARHTLGGQSDPGGTIPLVKSIGVISASSATFDQLYLTAQRFINGTSVVTIETMSTPYSDSLPQEDAYYGDCGGTYDSPIAITSMTNGDLVQVTAPAHGIGNGSSVLITDVIGLNYSAADIDGVIHQSSLVNERTFIAASVAVNSFYLQDFQGGFISASSYSTYFSGGRARKLVSSIGGLTWLKGETVGVLADGGNHPDAVVSSSGVLALTYPAAKVQIGYRYNSDGSTLRSEAGSATGSSIGQLRKINRAAFLLHAVGDFSFGPNFARLTPCEFPRADEQIADIRVPLFSGITRDSLESGYDYEDGLCFRQSSMLPGMIQSITNLMDETDV